MRVLVVGGGGREHALAWKLAQSPRLSQLFVAPGNAGTAGIAANVPIAASDIPALVEFARARRIDLTVVGPDDPLAAGIVDAFREAGLRVFGPTKAAAQIESSKALAKQLMQQSGVPTAQFATFDDYVQALAYIRRQPHPLVIKASGLALGKGVTISQTVTESERALKRLMQDQEFGAAGTTVVIEEFLEGPEVSVHAVCDGCTAVMFPSAQDHKPIGDGDVGPNTGGMGTFAPVPWFDAAKVEEVRTKVVNPVLSALAAAGQTFSGCLYPGLKVTPAGVKVLEFNARFGDPETQSYMRLLKSDLLELLEACADGRLDQVKTKWHPGFAVCVVLAAAGYPGVVQKGDIITGLDKAAKLPGVEVFQAGTARRGEEIVTNGGRVLGVTAIGTTLREAIDRAYAGVNLIKFNGLQYRRDIGQKGLTDV